MTSTGTSVHEFNSVVRITMIKLYRFWEDNKKQGKDVLDDQL